MVVGTLPGVKAEPPVGASRESSSLMVTVGAAPMVTQGLSAVTVRVTGRLAASTRLLTAVRVAVTPVVDPAGMVTSAAPRVYTAALAGRVTTMGLSHALPAVAVRVVALTRAGVVVARSQMVVGEAVRVTVTRCCAAVWPLYLRTGYWDAVPKLHGSSSPVTPSRLRFQSL